MFKRGKNTIRRLSYLSQIVNYWWPVDLVSTKWDKAHEVHPTTLDGVLRLEPSTYFEDFRGE